MGDYSVIAIDPPWAFKNKRTGGSMKSGAVQQYPTMTMPELLAMPIGELAAPNSFIFMWATAPLLPEALDLLRYWGYTYKTNHVWDKEVLGMGFNFRIQTEYMLVGYLGKVKPFRMTRERNIHREKPSIHSRKPEYYRGLIEAPVPEAKRLEMFARKGPDDRWDVFGNQAPGSIVWDYEPQPVDWKNPFAAAYKPKEKRRKP